MLTRIQKLYFTLGLVFVGLYYLLNYYPNACLTLSVFAIIITLSNIYNYDINKILIMLIIQLVIGFLSRMFFIYDCAIILVIANTLVCTSFQDVYLHSSRRIRHSLNKFIYILVIVFLVILLLWTLLPLNIIASMGETNSVDIMSMLILIVLIFIPIFLEYISLKI